MKNIHLSLVIFLMSYLILSCGNDAKNNQDAKGTSPNVEKTFSKTYEGKINGKYGIKMNLSRSENYLNGTYYYTSVGYPIKINGVVNENGNLSLKEYNDKGDITGTFKGQLNGKIISGNWSKPDGKKLMPFFIEETNNEAPINIAAKVTCTTDESQNEYGGEPMITKTCTYLKYKTISQGYPDNKGRYSYEYELYSRNTDGIYVQIRNSDLFNERRSELLSLLNSKIKKTYNEFQSDPETSSCFDGAFYQPMNFDQLGIEFGENEIVFHATFNLVGACMSVDGTIISFSLNEIKKYLKD